MNRSRCNRLGSRPGLAILGVLWMSALTLRAEVLFEEVSAAWGLEFRHHHGGSGDFYMPETMGSGVVIFDFDGDGDEDLFFVDSGPMPGYRGEPTGSALFRNDGENHFVDVTRRAGLSVAAYGMGVTAGDVDGDGDVDLYLTAFGSNQLFRNNDDGTFTDVTASSGVGDPLWSTSAAFADVDGDGDLDLYVTNYLDFSFDNNPLCGLAERKLRSYCHPDVYNGLADRFYRNRGDGTFADETTAAGFARATGKGMGVVFADLNRDGWVDLYVANDMTPNFLFRNRGDGTFEDYALLAGASHNSSGNVEAGMGVDVGDVDGNGYPDIVVTHLDQQTNALYSNQGGDFFVEGRFKSGLAEASLSLVGFGVAFGDLDQDADLDLVVANGHIIHNADEWGVGTTYRQRNQVFENRGGGRFEAVLGGLDVVRASRGLAMGDLDGDGDLDLAISNSDSPVEVYENVTDSPGGWLQVDLRASSGQAGGVGAQLDLLAGASRQTRERRTASSYLSQGSLTVHFGVGAGADRLEVLWPSGRRQAFLDPPISKRILIVR